MALAGVGLRHHVLNHRACLRRTCLRHFRNLLQALTDGCSSAIETLLVGDDDATTLGAGCQHQQAANRARLRSKPAMSTYSVALLLRMHPNNLIEAFHHDVSQDNTFTDTHETLELNACSPSPALLQVSAILRAQTKTKRARATDCSHRGSESISCSNSELPGSRKMRTVWCWWTCTCYPHQPLRLRLIPGAEQVAMKPACEWEKSQDFCVHDIFQL